jgi:nicotinate dehydrogenase subunit B
MNATFMSSRRELLKGTSALIVAFSLGEWRGGALAQELPPAKSVALDQVDTFLAIDGRGMVTIYSGKVELGTGVRTALTQIAADELDVPIANVEIIQGDTALTPDQGPTYGSLSIQNGGVQIRQAAATARSAILGEAASRLGVAKQELTVTNGVVAPKSGGSMVTYAELVGGKAFALTVDAAAPTKDPKDFKFVGQPMARLDIPGKLTGQFTYMHDFRVSGMLHGRVVRPPAFGATLESVDESSIKHIPGIVKVVREGNFLGVVALEEWSAVRAARELVATWSKAETLPDEKKALGACPCNQDRERRRHE